jgi:hypothetical protein
MEGANEDEILLETDGESASVDYAQWSGITNTREQWDNEDLRVQAKFKNKFRRLALDGYLPWPDWKDWNDGVGEIEIHGHQRAGAFRDGRTWCISHFWKSRHNKNDVNKQKPTILKAKAEHLAWVRRQSG